MAPSDFKSSNAGSNQGKEQLNRQVRRPLVQMAAVKLGSQPFWRRWLLQNSIDEATNKKNKFEG